MTQPNQDKVGDRIREILLRLYNGAREDQRNKEVAIGLQTRINQALLQIKEAMKVDEGEIDQVICEYRNAGKEWNSVLLAHSICDYLEGR